MFVNQEEKAKKFSHTGAHMTMLCFEKKMQWSGLEWAGMKQNNIASI